MSVRKNYNHTIYASYLGYVTQAIVNNFAPLLFLTFAKQFSLTLDKITLITTVNFGVQLTVDFLSAKLVDRIGYRVCAVAAHVFSAAGLMGLAVFPFAFPNAYAGILLSVVLYAVGGGLIEVMISPIVEACPTERKEAAMSLLHSFYCWGHLAVILFSTLFFAVAGTQRWRLLAVLWALIPIVNAFYFTKVPLFPIVKEGAALPVRGLFCSGKFWLLLLIMVCSGASEHGMSQWASAFAESALGVSKTVGDLAGPGAFALMMGTSRAIYGKWSEKLPLKKTIAGCAVLCICAYLIASFAPHPVFGLIGCALCGFSVGIFWTGTFSIAAWSIPAGGTAMYAFMALAGDVGCSLGPTLVGFTANAIGGDIKKALPAAMIFPILILFGMARMKERKT